MADGKVVIGVEADSKQAVKELDKVEKEIEDVQEVSKDTAQQTDRDTKAMAMALSGITASLVAAGLKAYEMSSQFGAAFAKTKTIMDEGVMSAGTMRSAILDLSKDSAMAAGDVSEAVYAAISGSVDTADAVVFVDKANRLAVAGFTSLGNATDVLTTSLNAYHLGAEAVAGISNVLIATQNLGKTSVDELSASMGKAIATGSAYNVDLQNLSTAYVELTRNGIATAESTTYINSMLNELGDSSKTVGKIIMEQTGKSFGQLMQDGWSLADVLDILYKSVDGDAEALMGLWGSAEAGKAANAIISQSVEDFNTVLRQMNAEMSGTTGTTEKAYETMTSTSEFIDRRLKNSVTNLAIAYGDVLTPALDGMKSIGADVLEWLTGVINDSPEAASAIAALSTGVTVLAGGLAALMIIQKVQEAFGGFTALLASNPAIIAAAGVAALVVGITSLVSKTQEENQYLQEFNTNLGGMKESLEKSLASVDVAKDQVSGYVSRLKELEAAGLTTTEQQEEYHQILVKLTETVPELADLIDLETDSIKGGTDAILANTDAWAENARQQAYLEYMADLDAARTQALIDQAVAQKKLDSAIEEGRPAIDAYNQALADGLDVSDEAEGSHLRLSGSLSDLESASTAASSAINEAQAALDASKTAAELASQEYDIAKEAINGLTEEAQTSAPAVSTMGKAMEETAGQSLAIKDAVPQFQTAMEAFKAKYDELYSAAKSSLEGQFKLWEQVDAVTAKSIPEANKGIQSQIDYWNRYNADLQTIKNSGIAGMEELYRHISDGSTDSVAMAAGIADAIREGNQPAVEDMIVLYADLSAAQGDAAASMVSMQSDVDQALREMRSAVETAVEGMELPDSAYAAASNTIDAYVRAIYNGKGDAVTAARAVANAVVSAMTSGTVRGRPSVQAYASGTENAASGVALVGEEGPELIYLRGGERILTAEETRAALSSIYVPPSFAGDFGSVAPASMGGGHAEPKEMTIVVPVQIDGREFARVTARTMGEEMMFDGY